MWSAATTEFTAALGEDHTGQKTFFLHSVLARVYPGNALQTPF